MRKTQAPRLPARGSLVRSGGAAGPAVVVLPNSSFARRQNPEEISQNFLPSPVDKRAVLSYSMNNIILLYIFHKQK